MEKLFAKKKKEYLPLLVFVVFGVALLLQYSKVYLYFDDFGYLSLSYGYETPGVEGHSYGFAQLLEFMKMHYFEANGRLLYTGLFVFLFMIGGLNLLQVSMAFIVLGTAAALYLTILNEEDTRSPGGEKNWLYRTGLALTLCLLFGTIGIEINRQGTYWFAASFAYITPCIPFLGLAAVYGKTIDGRGGKTFGRSQAALACLLAFAAGFSQEQWWVAVCTLIIGIVVCKLFTAGKKALGLADLSVFLCALAGGGIIVLSPAAAARLGRDSANLAFGQMSFVDKVITNSRGILGIFATGFNQPYLSVLVAALFLMALWMLLHNNGKRPLHLAYMFLCVFFIAGERWIHAYFYTAWILFLTVSFVEIVFFYGGRKHWLSLIIFISAMASLGCMAVVPELPTRIVIPFLLLSLLLIGDIAACWLRAEKPVVTAALLLLLACVSVPNMLDIYRGYRDNYLILMVNQERILNACESIEDGASEAEALLERQKDYRYGGDMMYHENFGFMEYWLRQYFNVPEGVRIVYKEE